MISPRRRAGASSSPPSRRTPTSIRLAPSMAVSIRYRRSSDCGGAATREGEPLQQEADHLSCPNRVLQPHRLLGTSDRGSLNVVALDASVAPRPSFPYP